MSILWRTSASPQAYMVQELKILRTSQRDILRAQSELDCGAPKSDKKKARYRLESAIKAMDAAATRCVAMLDQMNQQKTEAKANYRQFQIDHGLARDAAQPDTTKAILVLQGCVLAEGLLTAGLMIADGKMDIMGGLVYGLSVSAINIATGVMAGFFPARYSVYKLDSPYQTTRNVLMRTASRFGMAGFVSLMATLHFSAARVRATGSHADIFNFSQVGFWDTFSDFYGIAIVVAGGLGGILALYEGFQGLSDPVPNFSKIRKAAEHSIDAQAEAVQEAALEAVENLYEDACDDIEDESGAAEEGRADFRKAAIALNDRIAAHNHAIDHAQDRLRVLQADEHARKTFVAQKKTALAAVDVTAFDTLRLNAIPLAGTQKPAPQEQVDFSGNLQASYEDAVGRIREAYALILSNTNQFNFNHIQGE
jgi:hypothetical protein